MLHMIGQKHLLLERARGVEQQDFACRSVKLYYPGSRNSFVHRFKIDEVENTVISTSNV